ncbi:Nif3-like dinuclear metal center hexameric protein [Bordetella pertussis]|nr:hypothetical protein CKW47_06095 [Bordetella pertussis]
MGPLQGTRVVELAGIGPAPMACMLLADLGAEVVRIERAESVELGVVRPARYNLLMRNRCLVAADLKQPAMVEQALDLVARADVLVEGFRPGVAERLGRTPLVVGEPDRPVRRVAWCTGGAQGMLADAVDAGADAYITGEASESTVHLARETGVAFVGAGHHATERYGVQALGEAVARQFGIRVEFIDIDNPV